ncbi:MAG: hypothetical protein K6F99_04900 [Lachnospiraceae bacterium]|nr:hypothetical protein [Lachnospiraceae bacterium]
MEVENALLEQFRKEYTDDINILAPYVPYFTSKKAADVSKAYDGKYGKSTLSFPVFDSTLMDFVKKAGNTHLIDRNYPYIYSRNRITSHQREIELINKATIKDLGILKGCFSKYIIEGRTKATRWAEGVEYGIYLAVIEKLLEIKEFYKNI